MKTLGLDISTVSTGWAVLSDESHPGAEPKLVEYGCINFDSGGSFSRKLIIFREMIKSVLDLHSSINYAIIEDTYVSVNPRTTKQLNRFAGVAIESISSYDSNIKVLCVTAMTIRAGLFPKQRTDKAFVYKHMIEKYKLDNVVNDITDAIACASLPFNGRIEQKWIQ